MLTRAGWFVLGVGVLVVFAGRMLGVLELFVMGTAIVAVVGVAILYVRLVRLRLDVARDVRPLRVHAGQPTRVEVRATNTGRTRTPMLSLSDPVDGTKGARLRVAPLARAESARAAYRLPTARRGIVGVGPLQLVVADPFGLATISAVAAPHVELLVLPHVDTITAPTGSGGQDPHAGSDHPNALGRQGEDFHSLRPYVIGDDLRRVHWPSSARHDDLMVRTEEVPWQGHCTVVVDLRRNAHSDASFEIAVSAAASIVAASFGHRDAARLVTTDAGDVTAGDDSGGLVEYLATVQPSTHGSIRSALGRLSSHTAGGALVVVCGIVTSGDLDAIAASARRYSDLTIVLTQPGMPGTLSGRRQRIVMVSDTQPFATAWEQVHGRRRPINVGPYEGRATSTRLA